MAGLFGSFSDAYANPVIPALKAGPITHREKEEVRDFGVSHAEEPIALDLCDFYQDLGMCNVSPSKANGHSVGSTLDAVWLSKLTDVNRAYGQFPL